MRLLGLLGLNTLAESTMISELGPAALLENGDALKFVRLLVPLDCKLVIQWESAGAGMHAALFTWRANTIRLVKK